MKKLMCSFLVFGLLTTATTTDTFARTIKFDPMENVPVNKTWRIIFNQDIDSTTLKNHIKIIGKEGDLPLEIRLNGNTVEVTPKINLNSGESYILRVTEGIQSKSKIKLKEGINLDFVTSDDSTGKNKESNSNVSDNINNKLPFLDKFDNEYGMMWKMSHNNYRNFILTGIEGNSKVGEYTNQKGYSNFGITIGDNKSDVISLYGNPLTYIQKGHIRYNLDSPNEYGVYFIDGKYVSFFYDIHKNNELTAIHWVTEGIEYKKNGFFGEPTEFLRDGFEDIMVELINATRVKEGLNPLIYSKEINPVARNHSTDMVLNNYFSHVNPKGESPADRFKKANIKYSLVGENLAYGQFSSSATRYSISA